MGGGIISDILFIWGKEKFMLVIWKDDNSEPVKNDLLDCWLELHHILRKIPDYEPKPKPKPTNGCPSH